MKRTLMQSIVLATGLALLGGTATCLAADTAVLQSCSALDKKLNTEFPDLLTEQPSLSDLTQILGPYAKKERIGTRYEWEENDFMLIIQEAYNTTDISIVPEKIEKPGEPTLHMPDHFENLLRIPPKKALAEAKSALGTDKMKETVLYQYAWKCAPKASEPEDNKSIQLSIRAQFNDRGDFVALID